MGHLIVVTMPRAAAARLPTRVVKLVRHAKSTRVPFGEKGNNLNPLGTTPWTTGVANRAIEF